MLPRPLRVFISATSVDLQSAREAVRDALLTLGYFPVEQSHFGPDPRTLLGMLREKINNSAAVIYIVGECYGAEPRAPGHGDPQNRSSSLRRSYTQWEYYLARDLRKPLYVFVCADDYPYDDHVLESEEKTRLQRLHREMLLAGDQNSSAFPTRPP